MNIVSRILAVKCNGYYEYVRNELNQHKIIDVYDIDEIKDTITKILNNNFISYLLVRYNENTYLIERTDDGYCKKVIHYHPLMEKVIF